MNVKTGFTTVIAVVVLWLYIRYKIITLMKISSAQNFKGYNFVDSFYNITRHNSSVHLREDFLIDTPGCYIPNYAKDLAYGDPHFSNQSCGQRAVFIEKRQKNKILFRIDRGKLLKKSKIKNFQCCCRFVKRSNLLGKEDTHLNYSSCLPFKDKSIINLNEEVVTVRCIEKVPKRPIQRIIYEDAYIVLKELTKRKTKTHELWNVVVLGLPSMSRGRMLSLMPSFSQHIQANKWLEFMGFNKVAWNTYDNFMSLFTGRRLSTINQYCGSDDKRCNDLMIWSKFKEAGYVTAYGEDNLNLRDKFAKNRFKAPPTDHYMRPFFLTGEKRVDNIICTQNVPSVKHLLNYAYDFISAYKNANYFGAFLINSCSTQNMSAIIDSETFEFLKKLQDKNLLRKTFVFIVGANGNKYGDLRIPINSYYEERLPVLFVKIPDDFKKLHKTEYHNLVLNQDRLITPYDVYVTFGNILNINNTRKLQSEACSRSTSLFEEKLMNRTCFHACIEQRWCSCHNLTKLQLNKDANRTLSNLIAYIQNRANDTRTLPCTSCEDLSLKNIFRMHTYNKVLSETVYVIAIEMNPGKLLYEAIVDGKDILMRNVNITLLQYNRKGYCVINEEDRPYCVCKTLCTN